MMQILWEKLVTCAVLYGVQGSTNKRPRLRIALMAIFFLSDMCRDHRDGVGRITIERSRIMFVAAELISCLVMSPQCPPPRAGSHCSAMGWHMRPSREQREHKSCKPNSVRVCYAESGPNAPRKCYDRNAEVTF